MYGVLDLYTEQTVAFQLRDSQTCLVVWPQLVER